MSAFLHDLKVANVTLWVIPTRMLTTGWNINYFSCYHVEVEVESLQWLVSLLFLIILMQHIDFAICPAAASIVHWRTAIRKETALTGHCRLYPD